MRPAALVEIPAIEKAGLELRPQRLHFPKVTFQRNIRFQLRHRGSRDEVIRETIETFEVARELGAVLVGVSNIIMPGTSAENTTALIETIARNRQQAYLRIRP